MGKTMRASSSARVTRDQLERVHGKMAFARRSPEEEASIVSFPGYENVHLVRYDEVTIRNVRPMVDQLSLDKEGFVLVQHENSCASQRDTGIVRDRYLEEMIPFIKEYFNASWVVPRRDGVVVRSGERSVPGAKGIAGVAHIDYAPISARMVAARQSQLQGIPIRSYSRLMIIQAWRALSPPPQDVPLAICDASSVLDTDIVVHDYSSENGAEWKSAVLHYSPGYRWYYFPEMTSDELLLFKGYDSVENLNAQAAYAAFDNRRAHPNAEPRESIEAQFFVYYR